MELLKQQSIWLARAGKVPCGKHAQWMKNPQYTTYKEALAYKYKDKTGVGLVTGIDGVACIDLDGVLIKDTEGYDIAMDLVERADSYTEASLSQTGLHLYGYYSGDLTGNYAVSQAFKAEHGYGMEVYLGPHFVAWTGTKIQWTPNAVNNITKLVDEVVAICCQSHSDQRMVAQERDKNVVRPVCRVVDSHLPRFTVQDVWNVKDKMNTCPTCGSTHNGGRGLNFSYDVNNDLWTCFHDSISGGNAWTALAVAEGFITCKEARKGGIDKFMFAKLIKIAKRKFGKEDIVCRIV